MKPFPDIPQPETPGGFSLSNPSGHTIPATFAEFEIIISLVEKGEGVQFHAVELVYVDEDEIGTINREHLGRNYVTDIISFRYDENEDNTAIEGTLYCCAPRIEEQSKEFGTQNRDEFFRVFIHGLLHLTGYDDQTPLEKQNMTTLEDQYLTRINQLIF